MTRRQWIIDKLLTSVGLYDQIYGKNTDLFLFNQEREQEKNLLTNVFWYTDTEELFPREVDEKRNTKMTRIFFSAWEEEKKGLFSNWDK